MLRAVYNGYQAQWGISANGCTKRWESSVFAYHFVAFVINCFFCRLPDDWPAW
jgi:hypothetical protein